MTTLYLIRGLPGSGKSTEAERLFRDGIVSVVHEADDFFTDPDGTYRFDPQLLSEAHVSCQSDTLNSLRRGLNVAVSNTFSQEWEIEPYRAIAQRVGAELVVINMTGSWGSIHDVPDAVVDRMRDRWEDITE